jgi:hypothetical protein
MQSHPTVSHIGLPFLLFHSLLFGLPFLLFHSLLFGLPFLLFHSLLFGLPFLLFHSLLSGYVAGRGFASNAPSRAGGYR